MSVKRSEVRSFRLKKEIDDKFQQIHQIYKDEYMARLEAAGIMVDRPWSFTDTFERMIQETAEKSPSVN